MWIFSDIGLACDIGLAFGTPSFSRQSNHTTSPITPSRILRLRDHLTTPSTPPSDTQREAVGLSSPKRLKLAKSQTVLQEGSATNLCWKQGFRWAIRFPNMMKNNSSFINKTFIPEQSGFPHSSLAVRPRRFGKTTKLSLLLRRQVCQICSMGGMRPGM